MEMMTIFPEAHMRIFKKTASTLIAQLLLFITLVTAFAVTPQDYSVATPENLEAGHLYGSACILIDAETGRVLFEKNANERRYPASTTKIMTCILAIEEGPMGETVTIPSGIEPPSGSSKMGISTGEVMLFDDLVYGMMMSSGNEAAIAIAILTSGTEKAFVNMMNDMAANLGLSGTHFVNSHGYHTVNHYTTAHDLAVITRYAMQNETFRDIAGRTTYEIPPTNLNPNGFTITTRYDPLIEGKPLYYEPCIGVKTGYTNAAGRCFVGAGETDGQMLISVTLGTDPEDDLYSQAFTDTIRLLKYGFLQYEALSFSELYSMCDDTLLSFRVEKSHPHDPNNGYLRLTVTDIPENYHEWFLKEDLEDVNYQAELVNSFTRRITATFDGPLIAPITKGDVVGTATFETLNGDIIVGSLVASRNVERKEPTMDEVLDEWIQTNAPWLFKFMPRHNPGVRYVYWALFILIIALIVWRTHVRRKKERARREALRKKLLYQKQLQKKRQAAQAARRRAGTAAPAAGARPAPRPASSAAKPAARPAVKPTSKAPAKPSVKSAAARSTPSSTATSGRNMFSGKPPVKK